MGSFRILGSWPDGGTVDWVRFAYLGAQIGGNADFEIPGSKRDAVVWWARFVTPPVFGAASSLTMGGIIPYLCRKSKFLSAGMSPLRGMFHI